MRWYESRIIISLVLYCETYFSLLMNWLAVLQPPFRKNRDNMVMKVEIIETGEILLFGFLKSSYSRFHLTRNDYTFVVIRN